MGAGDGEVGVTRVRLLVVQPPLDVDVALGSGHCITHNTDRGVSSVGAASDWNAGSNEDAGSIPRCAKRFFSQTQLSVQTLSRCP